MARTRTTRPGYSAAGRYVKVPTGGTLPAGWKPPPAAETIKNLRYGSGSTQELDLYLPDATEFPGPRPVLLWLHAGGWISENRTQVGDVIQREYSRGYAVASVEYALAPANPFPAALHDVKLAIRFLKANAATYDLDSGNIIASGGSSGGNLAMLVGLTPGRLEPAKIPAPLSAYDDKVAAVVDLVGPTDLAAFVVEKGSVGDFARSMTSEFLHCTASTTPHRITCPRGSIAAASAKTYVASNSPPLFMAFGAQDTLVPPKTQAVPIATKWAAAKPTSGSVWLQIIGNAGHNISVDKLNVKYFDLFLAGVVARSIR